MRSVEDGRRREEYDVGVCGGLGKGEGKRKGRRTEEEVMERAADDDFLCRGGRVASNMW